MSIRSKKAIKKKAGDEREMSMKPFHTIAVPHSDILEGRLGIDVYAADLWEVYNKRGPEEYRDAHTFFKRTYMTTGLKNLLDVVEKRLLGGSGGEPVIHLSTPFGGGKTHALIALYHKAREWNVKTVVIVGTQFSADDTIWGEIEKQLCGRIERLSGYISPGRERLRELLDSNRPVMILMDEVLEYLIKASGKNVGESTLATQTLAFMQELTEVARTLDRVCIVATLPSSTLEHYDEHGERLFVQLKHILGRIEKVYTPVSDEEVTKVIRRRLFSYIEEREANKIVDEFVNYADREGILPPGIERSEYTSRFRESYPFLPEVVDVLYHRWGSFPNFQRTRGVLRLLALVVHSLRDSDRSYITLADFDLSNKSIRGELVKQIGSEYESVIAADITDTNANAKKVDTTDLGRAYQGLRIGSRAATTIFMYSFSGGEEKGAYLGEIKMHATLPNNPSSLVGDAVEHLTKRLFYLQKSNDDKYFFSNQPNINRIVLLKMENIRDRDLEEEEKTIITNNLSRHSTRFKVFLWPERSKDIPDTQELKLIVMKCNDKGVMRDIMTDVGDTPRTNRNTLIFLCPKDDERTSFKDFLRKKIAYNQLLKDPTLNLTEDQKRQVKEEIRKIEEDTPHRLKTLYRLVYLPAKNNELLKEIDLGIPTVGEEKNLDERVYKILHDKNEILERIHPQVIKQLYLREKEYIHTKQIYETMLTTPGESRVINREVVKSSIEEGVREGLFGLGVIEGDTPYCRYYREAAVVTFSDDEVLIRDVQQPLSYHASLTVSPSSGRVPLSLSIMLEIEGGRPPYKIRLKGLAHDSISTSTGKWSTQYMIDKAGRYEISAEITDSAGITIESNKVIVNANAVTSTDDSSIYDSSIYDRRERRTIRLRFEIPRGKVSDVARIMNYLQSKFQSINIELYADKGSIGEDEYNMKVKEALKQLGINYSES